MRVFVSQEEPDPNNSTLGDETISRDGTRSLSTAVTEGKSVNKRTKSIETSTLPFFRKVLSWALFVALVVAVDVFMRTAVSLPDYEKDLVLNSTTHFAKLFFSLVWVSLFFALLQKLSFWSRGIVFAIFFLPVAFCLYLRSYYGMEVDFSFVMDCVNTSWEEARGFISLHAIGILVAFVVVMFAVAWIIGKIPAKLPQSKIFVVVLVVALTFSANLPNFRTNIFPAKVVNDVKKSLKLYKENKLGFELFARQECEPQDVSRVPAEISHLNAVPIVVLHIGESARADHAPFNGYGRNTMPNMLREYESGNLVSFPKCVSFSTKTVLSLLGIICPSTVLDNAFQDPTFIPALNQSGVETCLFLSEYRLHRDIHSMWLDQIFGRMQKIFSTKEPALSFLPKIRKKLAEDVEHDSAQERFYIYYGEGSHEPFTNYDYEKHSIFKPNGTRKYGDERDINNYDNTFIATDEFCGGLIDALRDENAVYIFVGDHGTMLGEDNLQGRPYRRPESRHVLLFVWASDKFKAESPELWATLLRNRKRLGVVSHDFVYSSILHLFSLKTEFYEEKADLFSDSAEPFPVEIPDAEEFGPIRFSEDSKPILIKDLEKD